MFRRLATQAEGQGLVEYGLILVLVAVVVVMALRLLGPAVGGIFGVVVDSLAVIEVEKEEPPPECYGSLLLPIMVSATGMGIAIAHLSPGKPRAQPVI
jgi:pilus assembly protein Flp/PilA